MSRDSLNVFCGVLCVMLTDVLVLEGERLDVRLLIDRPIVRN